MNSSFSQSRTEAAGPIQDVSVGFLQPPYRRYNPLPLVMLGGTRPPAVSLGSIVRIHGQTPLHTFAPISLAVQRIPGVAVAVSFRTSTPDTVALLRAVFPEPDRVAIDARRRNSTCNAEDIFAIKQLVVGRPGPTPTAMSEYMAGRCLDRSLADAVHEQFRATIDAPNDDPQEGMSVSALSRFFRRYGDLTARDWRAVARLVRYLNESLRRQHYRDAGKNPLPISSQTASRYARRYLQMSLQEASGLVGWEWVLERTLRVGGYEISVNVIP